MNRNKNRAMAAPNINIINNKIRKRFHHNMPFEILKVFYTFDKSLFATYF